MIKFAFHAIAVPVTIVAAMLAVPAVAQDVVKPAAPPAVAVPVDAAAAATASEPAKPEIKVTATKPDLKDPDVVVCKWESDTGSRTKSTKICATRRQWAQNGREVAKQYQNQGNAASY